MIGMIGHLARRATNRPTPLVKTNLVRVGTTQASLMGRVTARITAARIPVIPEVLVKTQATEVLRLRTRHMVEA
jgi:hypothetical protein